VKEDIISRWFELGVSVSDGQITFRPTMLRDEDFKDGELRFTYCGTEIIYRQKSKVERQKNASLKVESRKQGLTLSKEDSGHLFARDGKIKQLTIEV